MLNSAREVWAEAVPLLVKGGQDSSTGFRWGRMSRHPVARCCELGVSGAEFVAADGAWQRFWE